MTRFGDIPLGELLEQLAAKRPAPGGGAAAGMLAGIAAGLAEMVIQYSLGKPRLSEFDALHQQAAAELGEMRVRALALAEQDARAYERLNTLQRLDETDEHRVATWPTAVQAAIEAPRLSLDLAIDLLELAQKLCGKTNPWLKSDLAIAAVAAEGAAAAAAWNIRVNLALITDESARTALETLIDEQTTNAREQRHRIETACT